MQTQQRFVVAIAALACVAGCGGSTMEPLALTCPLPRGTFQTTATREVMEGACPWAKEESHDSLSFDERGAVEVPLALADCRSVQLGCELTIRCSSDLFGGVRGTLKATVANDGESFEGHAVATGDFQGCRRVVYRVEAHR